MEIIDIFEKKGIIYGNSILVSDTEEKVINFHKEMIELDKKYPDVKQKIKTINIDGYFMSHMEF